jgi:uncharacterized protein
MVKEPVVKIAARYLKAVSKSGISISFGVIFGSYACGGADEMSDIDLLVVSPEFDGVVSRDFVNRLWRIAARTDSRIEPIPCGEKQWLNDNSNAIIEVARREGQTVQELPGG